MTRFYTTNTAGDTDRGTPTQEYQCESGHTPANSGTSHSHSIPAQSTNLIWVIYISQSEPDDLHSSATWPTTGWGCSLDVVTAGADLTYQAVVRRYTANGQTPQIGFVLLTGQTGTGVKSTTNVTWSAVNNFSPDITDVVSLEVQTSNSNMMSPATHEIRYSDDDAWVENTNFTPPSGLGGTLGITTETETPIAIAGKAKDKAVTVITASESSQALTANKAKALSVTTETEEALSLGTPSKTLAVGAALETDQAIRIPSPLVVATETDTPIAIGATKSRAVSLATETETPLSLTATKTRAISTATEADTALPITQPQNDVPVEPALETDSSIAVVSATKTKALGTATETEESVSITGTRILAVGVATETEEAQGLSSTKSRAVALASESDTPIGLSSTKTKAVGVGTETDTAVSVGFLQDQGAEVGVATEAETALVITSTKIKAIGTALEADTPTAVAAAHAKQVGIASETGTVLAFGKAKVKQIGVTTTTESVGVVAPPIFRFTTPTWEKVFERPAMTFGPKVRLTQSVSVVRINGVLTTRQTPTPELLQAAGSEGVDWFLGGRDYDVSQQVANALVAAGFEVTQL